MQLTPDVSIPDELIEASRAGRLVLFVGAGVSVNSPSGLPMFAGLARRVAEQLGEDYEPTTEPDQFLGDLAAKHEQMKELLRSIIDDPAARPNDNHHALAALAAAAEARIVTTNYDELIGRAAVHDGVDLGERYDAPALPLGRDFDGIVYLHGAVSRPSARLVATDQDFGRAYLTDGWARRFVHDLYLNWTVLFIGYSHDDVVMTYLARGLPRDTQRYALTSQPDHARWRRLEVIPVPYPATLDHSAVAPALEAWASLLRMGQLDHHARVKSMAAGIPPKEPHESDYLAYALTTAAGARGFAEAATNDEWLPWLETHPAFSRLFLAGRCADEASRTLAGWFAETMVADPSHSQAAFATVARMGPEASHDLRERLELAVRRLSGRNAREARRWEAIRLAALRPYPAASQGVAFNSHFSPLTGSELLPTLRRALIGRLVLTESRPWFVDDDAEKVTHVSVDVAWSLDERALAELLAKIDEDPLGSRAHALMLLEQALSDRYELMDAVSLDGYFDSWSYGRSAIEPHPQNQYGDHAQAIIDTLRDLSVEHAAQHPSLIARWLASEHALFRRLGLHLLIEVSTDDADARLQTTLDGGHLYDDEVSHELFRLLAHLGSSLSAYGRATVLAALLGGPSANDPLGKLDEGLQRRVRFDRLEWLSRHVTDWPELADALASVVGDEPMGVRDHPDFSHWMSSGTWAGGMPMPPAGFVAMVKDAGPVDAARVVLDIDPSERSFDGADFDGAVRMVQEAVALDPAIGLPLLPELNSAGSPRADELVSAVIYGWAASTPTASLAHELIEAAAELAGKPAQARSISELVKRTARSWKDILEESTYGRLDVLAQTLWDTHAGAFDGTGWSDAHMQGLNTWPGYLAQYWLYRISNRWRAVGDEWDGLSAAEAAGLVAMIELDGSARVPAIAILLRDLQFVYAADPEFAVEHLLPVLRGSDDLATIAFESFLYNPRAYPDLLDAGLWDILLSKRTTTLPDDGAQLTDRYWMLLAQILAFSTATSIDRPATIAAFAVSPADHDLARLTEALAQALDDLDAPEQQEVWAAWLGAAMRTRCEALPGVQSASERAAWGDLALVLATPEAIELAISAPGPLTHRTRFEDLADDVIAANAEALVRFATARLGVTIDADWHVEHELEVLVDRVRGHANAETVRALAELAVSHGITSAVRWSE